jgi:hypothetical protein
MLEIMGLKQGRLVSRGTFRLTQVFFYGWALKPKGEAFLVKIL